MDFDFVTAFFQKALESISVTYILSANFAIYFIIKIIDDLNKEKVVSKATKLLVTTATCLVLAALFLWQGYATGDIILTSALIVPISYKYVLKFFLEKFGVNYKKEEISTL